MSLPSCHAAADAESATTRLRLLDGDTAASATLRRRLQDRGALADPDERGREDVALLLAPCAPFAPDDGLPDRRLEEWLGTNPTPRRLILLSSTLIYPARPGHPGMLGERPARSVRPEGRWSRAVRRMELLLDARRRTEGLRTTVLRAPPVLAPEGDDWWHRRLRSRLVVTAQGFDPPWQLLWIDDLVSALRRLSSSERDLTLHLAPAAPATAREVRRCSGGAPLPLPGWFPVPMRHGTDRRRALRHPRTVAATAAAELGWRPRYSTTEAVAELARAEGRDPVDARRCSGRRDEFGLDREFCRRLSRFVLAPLHDRWFRVGVEGLERVPTAGGFVLSGPHRGYVPLDAFMLLHLLVREQGRVPRFLVHPGLLQQPFIAPLLQRSGGVVANQAIADRLLQRGEIVGVLPEGVRGAFAELRDVYRIRSFGRSDFVRIALRNRVPIVPFATVGPAESLPIWRLWKWSWWRRTMSWPGLPIGPLAPLPLPLPARWHTIFLEPIRVDRELPPEAADDRAVVAEVAARFRRRIEAALADLRRRRRSVWSGPLRPPSE